MILLAIIVDLSLLLLVIVSYLLTIAPVGSQDKNGFHLFK